MDVTKDEAVSQDNTPHDTTNMNGTADSSVPVVAPVAGSEHEKRRHEEEDEDEKGGDRHRKKKKKVSISLYLVIVLNCIVVCSLLFVRLLL